MEKMMNVRCLWSPGKLTYSSSSNPNLWIQTSVPKPSARNFHEQKYPTPGDVSERKVEKTSHELTERKLNLPERQSGGEKKDSHIAWGKFRENVISLLRASSVVSSSISQKVLHEVQKYVPSAASLKEKANMNFSEMKGSLSRPQGALDSMATEGSESFQGKLKSQLDKDAAADSLSEEQMFSKAMNEMNESITSFYEKAVASRALPVQKVLDQGPRKSPEAVKAEEDFAWTIVQSLWRSSQQTAEQQLQKKLLIRKDFVSKAEVDSRTKSLVNNIKKAKSLMSTLSRTEELCKHLRQYPDSRGVADKANIVPLLLKFSTSRDKALRAQANEALALVGFVRPVKARGMRVLAIDGGGTRGVVAIECLRSMELHCQTEVHNLFDYVCGVSTGALIAALVFLYRLSLDEVEHLYKEFSQQMFTRNKLLGTGKLVWSHAFYDTEIWEQILQQQMGKKAMIDFARDPRTPKLSGVSSLMNVRKMKNFLFRNYNLPPNVYSHYPGCCNAHLWEVIRASSAAPGYFDPFVCGEYVHQDGGLLTNNPTALALHESRLLWPSAEVQCVVSLGTGRHEPSLEIGPTKVSLKDKISKIVDSATDTEAVHMTMQDLLPPGTYFRLNPYMSEEFMLDEIRPKKIEQMQREAQLYLRKNEIKLQRLTKQLLVEKRPDQKLMTRLKETLKWV